MQIFVDLVERLNSPVYSAPPCILTQMQLCESTARVITQLNNYKEFGLFKNRFGLY